jgi:hypothetical protein
MTMSSNDERTLLANLCKQRDELSKLKLAASEIAALQGIVDGFIAEARKIVAVHGELLKRLEAQQAARKQLDAKDKALAANAKSFSGKLAAIDDRRGRALKALAEARKKAGADPFIKRVTDTIQELNMVWIDLSVFQDLQDW